MTQEIRTRYPHLIRSLRWTAYLTESEAVSAIVAHQQHVSNPSCAADAVRHWCRGRPVAVLIEQAVRFRPFRFRV